MEDCKLDLRELARDYTADRIIEIVCGMLAELMPEEQDYLDHLLSQSLAAQYFEAELERINFGAQQVANNGK